MYTNIQEKDVTLKLLLFAKQDIFRKVLTCKTFNLQSIKHFFYYVLSRYFMSVVFRVLKSTKSFKSVVCACVCVCMRE